MKSPKHQHVLFSDLLDSIASQQIWEYQTAPARPSADVCQQTFNALQRPDDFPPLQAAVVPEDRITIAIDPNVPQPVEVIRGLMKAIAETEAASVDIVLWDEASDETVAAVADEVGQSATVTRHDSAARECVRYLAADEAADPIYLNRRIVDADLLLPVVAARPLENLYSNDLTGVFPALADSATRGRHRDLLWSKGEVDLKKVIGDLPDIAWLLGVQMIVSVTVNGSGKISKVDAGTLEATSKRFIPGGLRPDGFPPAAPLVVASLDGEAQQQTWINAARAAAAACRFVTPGGTIVLWTEIDEPPMNRLSTLADEDDSSPPFQPTEEEAFPPWDPTIAAARALRQVVDEYRLLVHSQVDAEAIESMGLGVVSSAEELSRLSHSFAACGVLRAAQFAGSSVLAPYRLSAAKP